MTALADVAGHDYYDYVLDETDDTTPGSRGGYRGPGTAGADWCACGFEVSWPDGLPDDERAAGIRIFDEHESQCTVAHPELVQPSPELPSPAAVAELHVRHRASHDAMAADTIRRALQMVNRLRAVGLTPGPTARIAASYLETAVVIHPELRTWTR